MDPRAQAIDLPAGPRAEGVVGDNGRMIVTPPGVELTSGAAHAADVLTPEALDFVAQLHRSFNAERERLLLDRQRRQARIDAGEMPDFLPNPIESRDSTWTVARAPADLDDRRVEITGPAEPK